ncbi:ATP-binding protein [Streptomyces sp. NPDC046203]|uniref:ATP-binding protein n=1 Tax=Streptomyces sp. NPDC046203 TaxID=3154602 RepID=UPI0033D50F03
MTTPQAQEVPVTVRVFSQRFSSTPRGARLSRHLALYELDRWGIGYGTFASDAAAHIVAELAANAATHGRIPGRDFELTLTYASEPITILRIEVGDTRSERRPEVAPFELSAEFGRGLLIVDALASRWEVLDRHPLGKTVRAELDL